MPQHLKRPRRAAPGSLQGRLGGIVGDEYVRCDAGALHVYAQDATPLRRGAPDAIVFPSSVREIAGVLRLAAELGVPVVPRGAGSNLSAGSVPHRGGIVPS